MGVRAIREKWRKVSEEGWEKKKEGWIWGHFWQNGGDKSLGEKVIVGELEKDSMGEYERRKDRIGKQALWENES